MIAISSCASTAPSGGPGETRQTSIGPVYTDADGMTLYTYGADTPSVSHCTGFCALAWPPLEAAQNARPEGKFGIITRPSGTRQWTYKDAPLYTYFGDSKPGDVNGDGKDGVWYAAKP